MNLMSLILHWVTSGASLCVEQKKLTTGKPVNYHIGFFACVSQHNS